jgi:hypothetical protein
MAHGIIPAMVTYDELSQESIPRWARNWWEEEATWKVPCVAWLRPARRISSS